MQVILGKWDVFLKTLGPATFDGMIIAVNTRLLFKDQLEGTGNFIREIFSRLTLQHPEHTFYFFFDRPYPEAYLFSKNIIPVVLTPATRHPLLWKYWFDLRLPLALKKIKADVFISPDGLASLTSSVPQCLVIHDLGFLHHPKAYKKRDAGYMKRNTPKFVAKAKTIVTVSDFSKEDLIKQYQTPAEKISIVPNAARPTFQPLKWEVKEEVKEKYTEGREFFLYAGAIHPRKNLVNLLKAFSIFKKWQKSNWKLVLAGRQAWKNNEFLDLLKTYKYREDVVLTGYVSDEEMARLMASAYALVYPSLFEGFGIPVLEAMQSGIPALTSKDSSMEEIAGEGALYFDPADPADIADKMMLVYKDEPRRNELVGKGNVIVGNYNWQASADAFWQCILKTVKV